MTRPRRILARTFEDHPILEPYDAGSSLTVAAAGGGKTTCVALPTILSLMADPGTAIVINDVKDGEIAAQIAPICEKYGRKFAVVDEFEMRPELAPHRVSLNPFGDLARDAASNAADLTFQIENFSHALTEEPKDDAKGFFWREGPRVMNEYGLGTLALHQPRFAFPGGLHAFMSDPRSWKSALEVDAEEGHGYLRATALQILETIKHNPEHYAHHMQAALNSQKIFAAGPLREAGRAPTLTHRRAIEKGYIICLINPSRHRERLGPFFALQFISFMSTKLAGARGKLELVLDEYCNAPLAYAVSCVTIQRAYGIRSHFIAQSRQDSVLRYGEKQTAILEENCTTKQWLKFSNFEEAERVSRAMGEAISVSQGLGFSSDRNAFSANFSMGKDRLFTADELMRLPPDEQILHIAGVGFIHCLKIRQNQCYPYCHDLGENPLEGGRLPPDPKVRLRTPPGWTP